MNRFHWQKMSDGHKPSEAKLMVCLAQHAELAETGLKVSEVSRLLGLTPPTVTQLVNGLEEKLMVMRQADPADRRIVRINLTEQGRKTACRIGRRRMEHLNRLVEYLGEEDSNRLAELLLKMHEFVSTNDFSPESISRDGDENHG
ncbi:MarR family transcriptional regulator [Paenibacillus spiritus]|uniref:MarR family transcriptional regulator n=1 Tax=Paenibacillus spiritus TaxID=2496557 RepID=A0A5J5GJK3_9BACL|nr:MULTISPECIES: MarR family transcriptional regulator [Paenibacillus]KAA9008416.1 MarR family transcriptional regulator [Paenibacillus spiritus]